MQWTKALTAVIIAATLALIGIASFPSKPKPAAPPGTTGTLQGASASNLNARHRVLIDRYALSVRKLDSLDRKAPARGGERAVYSRLL